QKAMRELSELGPLAGPALHAVLETGPSLEVRRRVEVLLKKLDGPPDAETLRTLRAVGALESIGSAEARRLLEKVAAGAAGGVGGAFETTAAKPALARLDARRGR